MAQPIEGRCQCGAVRIALELPSTFCSHCHCESCRRAHSAPFVTWTSVPNERFRIVQGEGELTAYRSSEEATRNFCRRCGTQLFFISSRWPGRTDVPLSCL